MMLLSDPPRILYILLFIGLIASLGIWLNNRSRQALLSTLIFSLVLFGIYTISESLESPREEAIRRMTAIAEATQTNNESVLLQNISDQFNYRGTNKKQIMGKLNRLKQSFPEWSGGEVWDFQRSGFTELSDTKIQITCAGQAKNFPQSRKHIEAIFQKEGDQWKLLSVKFFDVFNLDKGEVVIPQFGS